jgi:hypothetical protein
MAQGRGGPRTKIIEHFSEGANNDPDFVKATRELDDSQQASGWLFGRGAFDRQDIMYLKEHKEEVRRGEEELDDMATCEYARLKSKASAELDAKVPQPGVLHLATKQKKEMK